MAMNTSKSRKRPHAADEPESDEDEFDNLNLSDEEGGIRIDDIYIPPPPKPACSVETTGPRLVITNIVNDFFKSYASQQKLGPFHKCFNAIIGPNGSGKSNVIDSLLFVFGYRASKIRSKKISVLLHNSERYRNVQSCTVSVHFAMINDKEGDTYEIIPGSEFSVSRTAYKDNSSYYLLNGKKVQFKEVARLLRQHGVDLDNNRFLILQGEVEQIAMMKCKAQNEHETGMLEYLEDIIGTSRYKVPLVKLQEKVDYLGDLRSEKLNRVKLIQKELDELKGPMQEAVSFLKTENTVVVCKNIMYQKNIHDLTNKVQQKEEKLEEIQSAHKEVVDKIAEINTEKKSKEAVIKEKAKKYESLEKRKDTLKEAFDKANNRDMQLLADMTQVNKTRKKTKELLAQEQKKFEKLERVPEENRKTIIECQAKQEELTAKKEKLESDKVKLLVSVRAETQDLQEKKEQLQTELVDLNKAVDETKSEFTLAESKLKLCLSNEENEKNKLTTMQETYENNQKTISTNTETVNVLKKKIPLTQKSLNSANEELNAVKCEEAQLISDIRRKRSALEETRSSMQASRSRGKVLDSLMQQKRNGKCPGLFGRLGDLGAIDQKYDVAISTACGPLDNIVVDTVATAQWCIEFLKQHNIGRATFIALEKQEHLRQYADSTIRTPENVPRLYDLVHIEDERVKTAFYFALRDTLVAKDLEQASRIAYGAQRYRVVTVGGDIIETTGTMSGGGKTVSRGRMGQSVTVTNTKPEDLDRMEQEVSQLENRVRELRQKQISLENQIAVLEPELQEMKMNYEKYNRELQVLKQQQPELAAQIKVQEQKAKSTKANPAEVEKLQQIVASKKSEYDEACATASVLQVEVDAVTKEIEEKTTSKIKAVDKSIKEATTLLNKCKAEITRLNVAIKTAERNSRTSREKIATMEQDIAKFENDLKVMQAEREETETDAKKLLTCIEEITIQLNDGQEDYSDIRGEVAELTKQENQLRAEKIEVDEKLKAATKSINEDKVNVHQWKAKLAKLQLQEIPDENIEELKTYTPEELEESNIQAIQTKLQTAEAELKAAKPNLNIINEYRKLQSVFIERTNELEVISEKRAKMRDTYDSVETRRRQEFLTGFNIIRQKLKEMYQMITLGGDANFEMVDTFDPFTEGIQFNVRPPKKSWKIISNLSGGEKTLSSLALVFALHYYKPSPLYIMDEIDAALDFKNVSIVGNYIKERTKNAQFVIISLRSNMFELCDNLIGIYKTFNCTKSVTIDPRVYENNNQTQSEPPVHPTNENAMVNGDNEVSAAMETVPSSDSEAEEQESSNASAGEVVPDSFEGDEMEVQS